MSWDRAGIERTSMGMGRRGMGRHRDGQAWGCLPYYHKSRIIPRSGGIPMPPHPCPTGMGWAGRDR